MLHFCTYFDHNYLVKGLTLYKSLLSCCAPFKLHILTLSRECHETLLSLDLENVILYQIEDLEIFDPLLRNCKGTRSLVEYYFTLSPCLPRYLFAVNGDVDFLTYVDADCMFFSDPTNVIRELQDHSVGLVEHRFCERLREFEICGKFNVGWLTYHRCEETTKILNWWRECCLEWCYDRVEPDRFADQKYLDRFPELFDNIFVIPHKGVNVAPWNVENHSIRIEKCGVFVEESPLVMYHFHGCKSLFPKVWQLGLSDYGVFALAEYRELYNMYINQLLLTHNSLGCSFKEKNRRGSFFSEDMLKKIRRIQKLFKFNDFMIV